MLKVLVTKVAGLSLKVKVMAAITGVLVVGSAITAAVVLMKRPIERPESSLAVVDENEDEDVKKADDGGNESEGLGRDIEESPASSSAENVAKETTSTNSKNITTPNNSTNVSDPATKSGQPTNEPAATVEPAVPVTPANPSTPIQPTADYNLNDRYLVSSLMVDFYAAEDTACSSIVESRHFLSVVRFNGSSSSADEATVKRAQNYASNNGYILCGGMGASYITWDQAVQRGIALDEVKCNQHGLSCGRW